MSESGSIGGKSSSLGDDWGLRNHGLPIPSKDKTRPAATFGWCRLAAATASAAAAPEGFQRN